jgi:hypothetical protein
MCDEYVNNKNMSGAWTEIRSGKYQRDIVRVEVGVHHKGHCSINLFNASLQGHSVPIHASHCASDTRAYNAFSMARSVLESGGSLVPVYDKLQKPANTE